MRQSHQNFSKEALQFSNRWLPPFHCCSKLRKGCVGLLKFILYDELEDMFLSIQSRR